MNIFALDLRPRFAAQYHCNVLIRKMGIESLQILSTAFPPGVAPFKHTHFNHPCSIWARQNLGNFNWLLAHADEIFKEYERRYKREHQLAHLIPWFIKYKKEINFPSYRLSPAPFARCFGEFSELLKTRTDTIAAYRDYYWLAKHKFAKWPSIEEIPYFWANNAKQWPHAKEILQEYVDKSFINGIYIKR